ncbi:primosomal protein [Babesia caballi]|uniref:Primosomal protein n=1 Tax=Babesia caballi TaxID=5871 RepID=A0AAV4LZ16_BABCB|nr:primosomal protein [Babesia caballi]
MAPRPPPPQMHTIEIYVYTSALCRPPSGRPRSVEAGGRALRQQAALLLLDPLLYGVHVQGPRPPAELRRPQLLLLHLDVRPLPAHVVAVAEQGPVPYALDVLDYPRKRALGLLSLRRVALPQPAVPRRSPADPADQRPAPLRGCAARPARKQVVRQRPREHPLAVVPRRPLRPPRPVLLVEPLGDVLALRQVAFDAIEYVVGGVYVDAMPVRRAPLRLQRVVVPLRPQRGVDAERLLRARRVGPDPQVRHRRPAPPAQPAAPREQRRLVAVPRVVQCVPAAPGRRRSAREERAALGRVRRFPALDAPQVEGQIRRRRVTWRVQDSRLQRPPLRRHAEQRVGGPRDRVYSAAQQLRGLCAAPQPVPYPPPRQLPWVLACSQSVSGGVASALAQPVARAEDGAPAGVESQAAAVGEQRHRTSFEVSRESPPRVTGLYCLCCSSSAAAHHCRCGSGHFRCICDAPQF